MTDHSALAPESINCQILKNPPITPSNILVIRPGALGDMICTLPALANLRKNFPQSRLEVVGSPSALELLKESDYADAIHPFDWAPFARLYNKKAVVGKVLRDFLRTFDYIIAYVGDELFLENLEKISPSRVFSVHPRKIPPKTHVIDHLLTPLLNLEIPIHSRTPYLRFSYKWQQAAQEFLENRFPKRNGQPLIGIHPGSGGKRKIWPHWWNFITNLAQKKNAYFLVFCGPAEKERIGWKKNHYLDKNIVENPPLPLLGALLDNCDVYLGNDSGVTHLAATTGRRTIALFGPSDAETWSPRGNTVLPALKCAECSDNPSCNKLSCLKNFQPSDLWNMVQSELQNLSLKNSYWGTQ